ncbi:MAG TPA: hypothetical protein VHV83_12735 [Armatimonadota bacterium]|nr:hypothetical protein [Armatimonadota bacterium]
MVYRVMTKNGMSLVSGEYVAAGTATAGDVVVLGAGNTFSKAAANATAALGWVTGDVSTTDVGKSRNVTEANDLTVVEMQFTGTLPTNPEGKAFGLAVDAGGVQRVNVGDTTNRLFKLLKVTSNTDSDKRCLVVIPSSRAQGVLDYA